MGLAVPAKKSPRQPLAEIEGSPRTRARDVLTRYLVIWWHLQKMYVGVFENDTEATLHAAARNGVVVELIGEDVAIGSVEDYWRRDDNGRPMPGEWRTARVLVPA